MGNDKKDVLISNATVKYENDNNNQESLKLNDILVAVDNSTRNLLSNGTVQYEDQPKLSEFESNATVQYRASLNINEILVDGVDDNTTKNELKMTDHETAFSTEIDLDNLEMFGGMDQNSEQIASTRS